MSGIQMVGVQYSNGIRKPDHLTSNLFSTIWIPNFSNRITDAIGHVIGQTIWKLDTEVQAYTSVKPKNPTIPELFHHLNTRPVQYLDPHYILYREN